MKHNYFKQLFIALLLLCGTVAHAYDFTVDGIYYNITDETAKTVEVTRGDKTDSYKYDVVIPESINYNGNIYSVTSIGERAFFYSIRITSVTIPNSVTTIGERAFHSCTGLTSITIPNSVTSIGEYTFSGCTGLTSVTIGNSVTNIGEYAFSDCKGLTSITIPNSVTTIEGNAFSGCTGLTNVTIPNSVTTIERKAFSGCTGLTSVTIPNSVTSIGEYAFSDCKGLTSITIPNSVTTIEGNAFSGCTGLTAVHISDLSAWCNIDFGIFNSNPLSYARNLYLNGELVTDLVIPNDVTKIKNYAFEDCTGLTSVTIPNSVTTIGERAFHSCTGLAAVHINDLSAWCNIDFSDSASNPLSYARNLYLNGELVTDLVIPNDVTKIKDYAFEDCTGLTSVTLGNSVTTIGFLAFGSCSSLTSITIPNSVTTIGERAFHSCTGLTSITIPNSVTTIGERAFHSCTGLTSVTIPNSVTSIGDRAFINCYGLKIVYNNSSLNITKGSTGYGCVAYYANAVITEENANEYINIDDYLFHVTDSVNTLVAYTGNDSVITLPKNCNDENYVIGDKAFYNCDGLTSVTIPNSVTSIGSDAFYGCDSLKAVHISSLSAWCNIDFIGSYSNPLYYAKNLYLNGELVTDLVIPNDVTKIKQYAFYKCTGLTSVTIPNSVTTIGERAFHSCTGLKIVYNNSSLNITKGSTGYGYVACYAAIVITEEHAAEYELVEDFIFHVIDSVNTLVAYTGNDSIITLPANCNGENYVIGDKAFYACDGLTSITIPNSVTSIGGSAFYGCTGLAAVHINDLSAWCNIYFRDHYSNPLYYAENLYLNGELVTELVIPNNVTEIKQYAFCYSTSLTSITIPNCVTSIGYLAFFECKNLTAVHINDLSAWCRIDFHYSEDYSSNPLSYAQNLYLNGELVTELVIPNDITEIKLDAFFYCESLTSVNIHNYVTNIKDYAFYYCNKITNVTIGNGVTSIGDFAFDGCSDLTEIYAESPTPATIASNTFSGLYSKATLYVPIGAKEAYQAAEYWKNFTNIVEMDMTGIEDIKPDESYNGLPDTYYDMQGRIVEEPSHGIYIYNGKKVFIK